MALYEQPSLYQQSPGTEDPQYRADKAYEWIIANKQPWMRFQRFVLDDFAEGMESISVEVYIMQLRYSGRLEQTDALFRMNNNHRSVLGRYLVKYHPELDGVITNRRGPIDDAVLKDLPYGYVAHPLPREWR